MINNSKVTKDGINGLEPTAPRILARQLARPLTDEEIDHISGGMIARAEIGGATATRRADTCSTTGCPANDSDC
jgi:hypothetical protein